MLRVRFVVNNGNAKAIVALSIVAEVRRWDQVLQFVGYPRDVDQEVRVVTGAEETSAASGLEVAEDVALRFVAKPFKEWRDVGAVEAG